MLNSDAKEISEPKKSQFSWPYFQQVPEGKKLYNPPIQTPFKYFPQKISTAFASVTASEVLFSTILFSGLFNKLKPTFVNKRTLTMRMIQYNSIMFSSKLFFDQAYKEKIQKNKLYHESNSIIYYKIGALTGLTTYLINIPLDAFKGIRDSFITNEKSFLAAFQPTRKNKIKKLVKDVRIFFTFENFRKMIHQISFVTFTGTLIYRTVYFGGYQRIKSRYDHPVNQYIIAPIIASTFCLVLNPLNQITYLQMTSHKNKSAIQIINEKGFNVMGSLSFDKVFSSVFKQASQLIFFVVGQNLLKNWIASETSQHEI